MKLAGRIPVVPLHEERMINIERRVVTGAVDAAVRGHDLRGLRASPGLALAAACVVAAGVVGWALHGAPAGGPVVAEPPAFRVHTSPQRPRVMDSSAPASGPERSLLDIGDARIESDPDTSFAVTRPDGGVVIAMARGKLALEVAKRGARPPLIVRAGGTDVVVVGTRFTVDYGDGSGDVAVRVTEGAVRVVHLQQETRVAAGQDWHTGAGLVAAADEGVHAEPVAPSTAAAQAGPPTTIAAAPEVVRDRAAALPDVLHDRKPAVPDAHAAPLPAPRIAAAPPRTGDGARPRIVVPPDPHVDLRTAIRAQRVEPALDIDEPNAMNAVTRYYEIAAHHSGDEASQAFYSIAVVRHFKLGSNPDALQTLDAYVRRFPGGKEYRAALWLRVRILCLDKLDDRCRAAAYTYLHQAPDTPAAHIAERITQAE